MTRKQTIIEDVSPQQHSFRLVFEKKRLETFKENWKDLKGFKHCTPENFAAAGFYNINSSNQKHTDTVRCFACQKELSDWEKEDDPWEEHVKRGNTCPFVIFRSKEKPNLRDFFDLQYQTRRILLKNHFEKQDQILEEKEKELMETISNICGNKLSKQRGRKK